MEYCQLLTSIGDLDHTCSSGQWCFEDPRCVGGTATSDQLNRLMPPCISFEYLTPTSGKDSSADESKMTGVFTTAAEAQAENSFVGTANNITPCPYTEGCCVLCISGQCQHINYTVDRKRYLAKPGSVVRKTKIDDIKDDILRYSSIVGVYKVFMDFIIDAVPTWKYPKASGWSSTRGIYVNVPGIDMYNLGTVDNALLSETFAGNHSICIVGWGIERGVRIPGIDTAIDLPYWECRNDWGRIWKDDGFFKIAMTQPKYGINTTLGLDIPIQVTETLQFGGCISMQASDETVKMLQEEPQILPIAWDSPERTAYLNRNTPRTGTVTTDTVLSTSSNQQWVTPTVISLFAAIIVALIVVFVLAFMKQRNRR